MKIYLLLIIFHRLSITQSANQLTFPHPSQQDFEFSMQAEFRSSMFLYPIRHDTGLFTATFPKVLYYNISDRQYYHRSGEPDSPCLDFDPISQSEVDSAIENNRLFVGDGTHRKISVINGALPGPVLVVNEGGNIVVNIDNRIHMQGFSLHFHGLHQRKNWFMDGVATLQQCPIPPDSTFVYRFKADPPGTHWYHGHFGSDRSEGLSGPFIVLPKGESPSNPKQNRFIKLNGGTILKTTAQFAFAVAGWYSEPISQSLFAMQTQSNKFTGSLENPNKDSKCMYANRTYDGASFMPLSMQSILINGIGWKNRKDLELTPWKLKLDTFSVDEDGVYLFRIIHSGPELPFKIWIENHPLHVVATDGRAVEETVVDSVILQGGERYDVAIITDQKPGTYYIHVETIAVYNQYLNETLKPLFGLAKLQYKSGTVNSETIPKAQKCSKSKPCKVLNCPFEQFASKFNSECVHLTKLKALQHPDYPELLLNDYRKSINKFEEYFLHFAPDDRVNGFVWRYPQQPFLMWYAQQKALGIPESEQVPFLKPCSLSKCALNGQCECNFHLHIGLGSVVQITLYNQGIGGEAGDYNSHPIHMHGHHFHVIKQGWGSYDPETGIMRESNKDLGCKWNRLCNQNTWKNSSWSHGRVPGLNLNNPVMKDTVILPPGAYIVIRFKADNPGWWMIHCHILLHHVRGMALSMTEGTHQDILKFAPDGIQWPSCGNFDPLRPKSDSWDRKKPGKTENLPYYNTQKSFFSQNLMSQNPSNPNESTAQQTVHSTAYFVSLLIAFVGGALLGVSIFGGVIWWRKKLRIKRGEKLIEELNSYGTF
jgi:FtsP/CotA-like multicopper oxidase with cupredoxin domain